MSLPGSAPLRVALLHHSLESPPGSEAERAVRELADALRDAGHRPTVLSSHSAPTWRSVEGGVPVVRSRRVPDAPLRRRGFAGPLTHIPPTLAELARGDYDLAHSFSPTDAFAARAWASAVDRPVVFTCVETLTRACLADVRLRRLLLSRAVEGSDAVTVTTDSSCAALWRWMAVEAPTIEARDAAAHVGLYRKLLARRPAARRPARGRPVGLPPLAL